MTILDHPTYFILGISIVISAILTLVNKVVIDQKRMKEINTKVKAYNKKLMKATRAKDQEELTRLQKDKPVIMQMQQELMKMQMPMFLSMLPFFVVFMLLRRLAEAQQWGINGEFLLFPWCSSLTAATSGACFSLPLFGASLGWLGWYIISSMPFTTLFRKLFGVQ